MHLKPPQPLPLLVYRHRYSCSNGFFYCFRSIYRYSGQLPAYTLRPNDYILNGVVSAATSDAAVAKSLSRLFKSPLLLPQGKCMHSGTTTNQLLSFNRMLDPPQLPVSGFHRGRLVKQHLQQHFLFWPKPLRRPIYHNRGSSEYTAVGSNKIFVTYKAVGMFSLGYTYPLSQMFFGVKCNATDLLEGRP